MLPFDQLEGDLRQSLQELAAKPLAEVLLQNGLLRGLASGHLRRRLRDSVLFSPAEEPLVIRKLFEGFAVEPPAALSPGWIEALPAMLQGPIRDRWDQLRWQKWMEKTYRDQIEPYFLERRQDLEQVVYGMIRLRNQGAAEELYLRLLDDQADFGELARQHSLGDERYTHGLVGPMLISQPHPTIRAVLQTLAVGEIHPPFRVDNWILLVRMEHRQPASLNNSTLLQLSQELMEKDLNAVLDQQLQRLYPQLVAAFPGLRSPESAGLAVVAAAANPQPVAAALGTAAGSATAPAAPEVPMRPALTPAVPAPQPAAQPASVEPPRQEQPPGHPGVQPQADR